MLKMHYSAIDRLQSTSVLTFSGENANVTNAFAAKLMSTAMPKPRPLSLRGNISEIINHPIGPNDI